MVDDKGMPSSSRIRFDIGSEVSHGTILVVEENEDSRDMLVELIRSFGFGCRGAANAHELFDGISKSAWCAALIDLNLSIGDGFEIARRLRRDAATCDRRLIALTGYSDESARTAATEAGFDVLLVRPILPEQLASALGVKKK